MPRSWAAAAAPGRAQGGGPRHPSGSRTPTSRSGKLPLESASSTSRARLRFCGRSSTPKRSNSARICVLTPSTLRKSSSAICRLVAGAACLAPAPYGRQSASSTRRCAAVISGGAPEVTAAVSPRGVARAREAHPRRAEAHDVAAAQPQPPGHAVAVDERPVARQPVVSDRPVRADPLELGVHARDLVVPAKADVGGGAAPDGEPRRARRERDDALLPVAVAEDEERVASPFGGELLLQLGGGRPMRAQGCAGGH